LLGYRISRAELARIQREIAIGRPAERSP
jgi:hypothetical protein